MKSLLQDLKKVKLALIVAKEPNSANELEKHLFPVGFWSII